MNGVAFPIYAYETARSALYAAEYALLMSLQNFLPDGVSVKRNDARTVEAIREDVKDLLRRDSENIVAGVYPVEVLRPESPMRHLTRIPKILADGISIYRRRRKGTTAEFDDEARELLSDTPRYYHRNFHFQTGGYLTPKSAELYEHQVEMLFGGAADPMRRLIIPALRERFGSGDGKGLSFLEIGAGTGRATRFVRLAFPRAKITAVDLSDPYLKEAERNLAAFNRIDFLQADAAKLPFRDGHFDAVYSVFLFHELPLEARREILAESRRVLKTGGFAGLVDSIQTGDHAAFDVLLENFPKNYHEPFFRNYASHPMETLLGEQGFKDTRNKRGFFSKACWAAK